MDYYRSNHLDPQFAEDIIDAADQMFGLKGTPVFRERLVGVVPGSIGVHFRKKYDVLLIAIDNVYHFRVKRSFMTRPDWRALKMVNCVNIERIVTAELTPDSGLVGVTLSAGQRVVFDTNYIGHNEPQELLDCIHRAIERRAQHDAH